MRVDWCVSSWFRIKNTHSLTHSHTVLMPMHVCPLLVAVASDVEERSVYDPVFVLFLVQREHSSCNPGGLYAAKMSAKPSPKLRSNCVVSVGGKVVCAYFSIHDSSPTYSP